MSSNKISNIERHNQRISAEERKASAHKAGIVSGEVRRRQAGLKTKIRLALRTELTDGEFAGRRIDEALAIMLVRQALTGDLKAIERVLDICADDADDAIVDYALERKSVTLEQRKTMDFLNDQLGVQ